MCLAIPLKVKEIKNGQAISSEGKQIDISLISEKVKVGSYLLVHDDLAVNVLPKQEAEKIKKIVGTCHHHDHSHDGGHKHDHSHSH